MRKKDQSTDQSKRENNELTSLENEEHLFKTLFLYKNEGYKVCAYREFLFKSFSNFMFFLQ